MTKFKKKPQGQQNNFKKKFNKFNKPGNVNKNNKGGNKESAKKKKKPAVNLVFDPNARKDFLTGFHKRKLEKKQHYKIKLQKQVLEEKQRIQAQAKKPAVYKSSSHAILPEVEALLAAEDEERNPILNNSESFEVGSKTVIVSSIDHSLHASLNNTNDNDSDEDEHELDLEEGDQESGGMWKTKVNRKGKSKVIYKSDTNKLLQNSVIFKKIQKLKQKGKKGRPKPNPHFKPKVAPGTPKVNTSSNDSKNKGSNSKNNLRRKGKQKSKGRK